jgi:hypothetical protein
MSAGAKEMFMPQMHNGVYIIKHVDHMGYVSYLDGFFYTKDDAYDYIAKLKRVQEYARAASIRGGR